MRPRRRVARREDVRPAVAADRELQRHRRARLHRVDHRQVVDRGEEALPGPRCGCGSGVGATTVTRTVVLSWPPSPSVPVTTGRTTRPQVGVRRRAARRGRTVAPRDRADQHVLRARVGHRGGHRDRLTGLHRRPRGGDVTVTVGATLPTVSAAVSEPRVRPVVRRQGQRRRRLVHADHRGRQRGRVGDGAASGVHRPGRRSRRLPDDRDRGALGAGDVAAGRDAGPSSSSAMVAAAESAGTTPVDRWSRSACRARAGTSRSRAARPCCHRSPRTVTCARQVVGVEVSDPLAATTSEPTSAVPALTDHGTVTDSPAGSSRTETVKVAGVVPGSALGDRRARRPTAAAGRRRERHAPSAVADRGVHRVGQSDREAPRPAPDVVSPTTGRCSTAEVAPAGHEHVAVRRGVVGRRATRVPSAVVHEHLDVLAAGADSDTGTGTSVRRRRALGDRRRSRPTRSAPRRRRAP